MKANTLSGLSVADLRRATELRESIDELKGELTAKNRALDSLMRGQPSVPGVKRKGNDEDTTPSGRPRNGMTMAEAITKITSRSPKTIDEIVAGLTKVGYKSSATRVENSVGAFLYGKSGKKLFKNEESRFSPK